MVIVCSSPLMGRSLRPFLSGKTIVFSVALCAFVARADSAYGGMTGLDVWTQHRPTLDVPPLFDISFGNDRFVAVGEAGTALTSTNGLTWVLSETGQTGRIHTISFGGGLFVALGNTYSCPIGPVVCSTVRTHALVSQDGLSWTNALIDTAELSSLAYGDGMFLAVGSERIFTSPDGLAWTERLRPSGLYLQRFILRSTDGSNWNVSEPDSLKGPPGGKIYTIGHAGRTYYLGMSLNIYGDEFFQSADAVNWTRGYSIASPSSVTFGNGVLVAVGRGAPFIAGNVKIARSLDRGRSWSPVAGRFDQRFRYFAAAYGMDRFVVAGSYPDIQPFARSPVVIVSVDGEDWITQSVYDGRQGEFRGIVFARDLFVAVGASKISYIGSPAQRVSKSVIDTSSDGLTWTMHPLETAVELRNVGFGNGLFLAVGNEGHDSQFDERDELGSAKQPDNTSSQRHGLWQPVCDRRRSAPQRRQYECDPDLREWNGLDVASGDNG